MSTPPTPAAPPSTPVPSHEPNALLRWLSKRYFSHIQVDHRWSEAVNGAAKRGTVVYVMRSLSILDFLCLDFLTKRFALPLIRFVNDLGWWMLEPLGKRGRRLRLSPRVREEDALSEIVQQRNSALLFLRRPPAFGKTSRKGQRFETDLLKTLVQTQRQSSRPILLVPQTFVWTKRAPNRRGSIFDFVLGPSEWPGKVRTFFRFLLNYRDAVLRTGQPFDLDAFLRANPSLGDEEAADKVRYALLRRMERERTLVLGPTKKSVQRLRQEILRSPRLRRHIESTMRSGKRSEASVIKEVDRELSRLSANQDPYVIRLLHRILDRVWNKIYDGLVVDEEGLERVREAARGGPLILMPSHKSHVDYLVLSDIFYAHQLSPPLIAAGDNLSFWPLGAILRRGGAFFIRRSFRGKKLYSALVDTYMRKLLLDGHHLELFIEGGRSRTGKLLPPKFGLLSMLVDACLALPQRKVSFVPISVGYELIVEQQSYVDELSGGDKQKENLGGLLKTTQVLRSKYGRLYIQFGDVLTIEDVLADAGSGGEPLDRKALSPAQRRNLIQRIGHRATYEINRVTVVTPVALVSMCLMANRKRGLTRVQLGELAETLRHVLTRFGARLGRPIAQPGPDCDAALNEALSLIADKELVTRHGEGDEAVFTVPEERRLALEYYKNNIVHFFVPSALISTALVVDSNPVSETALRERVRNLSRLFKYEFMYRADTDFDKIFADALEQMLADGEVERMAEHIRPCDGEGVRRVELYAAILRTYLEAYLLAVRGVAQLPADGAAPKDWVKRTLALGQRMYLAGELEHRESMSKHKLENAIQSLRDHKLVQTTPKGQYAPIQDPERDLMLEAFEERLRDYLR